MAGSIELADILEDMESSLLARWDPAALDGAVRRSQVDRLLITRALDQAEGSRASAGLGWGSADTS